MKIRAYKLAAIEAAVSWADTGTRDIAQAARRRMKNDELVVERSSLVALAKSARRRADLY